MLTLTFALVCSATMPQGPEFEAPIRLKAGAGFVKVESPGYAFPCWADVDGDKKKDLVVGQFARGAMKFYKGLGGGKLAEGKWLEAGGGPAEVTGVW
ncbi:MAG TPA: hypothetical protein VF384_16220 [Planctomycetota bacterium]